MMLYNRLDEGPRFGRAKIAGIEYGLRDGRVAEAKIRVASLLEYLLLKDEAIRRYGAGGEISGGQEGHRWKGDQTAITLFGNFTQCRGGARGEGFLSLKFLQ